LGIDQRGYPELGDWFPSLKRGNSKEEQPDPLFPCVFAVSLSFTAKAQRRQGKPNSDDPMFVIAP
jgi:hypothetical protein